MKNFISETKMTVAEELVFKNRLLDESQDFHFTQDQYENRLYGRTKIKPSELIVMKQILQEIRFNLENNII